MMKRVAFLMVLSAMTLSGCASTMGIYDTEFGCPKMENGECIAVEDAHDAAVAESKNPNGKATVISDFRPDPIEEREFLINEVGNFQAVLLEYEKCVKEKTVAECEDARKRVVEFYRSAEDRGRAAELHGVNIQERVVKLAAMEAVVSGGSSTVPVRQPDTVMELHIMPYRTTFGALASERVLWVVVKEGEWTWATNERQRSVRGKLGATE